MLVNVCHLKWQEAIKTERVCKEKNLPWLFGVDRKLCPSRSLFGITDAEQSPLGQSKKMSNDQELIQSDPTSCPQNQKGNN